MVNPKYIAANAEEERKNDEPQSKLSVFNAQLQLGMQKKKKKKDGEPQSYRWKCRRRRKMENPRAIAGIAKEEEVAGRLT